VKFKAGKNSQNNHKRRLEDQFGTQHTMIIEDVEIEGTLNTHENLRMGGNLKGHIKSSAVVWISKGGKIDGKINANGLNILTNISVIG
jgi:cytoskeletal protein CcmA (bactofilin family)